MLLFFWTGEKSSFGLEKPHAASSRSDGQQERPEIAETIKRELASIRASFRANASSDPHPPSSQEERRRRRPPDTTPQELMPYH